MSAMTRRLKTCAYADDWCERLGDAVERYNAWLNRVLRRSER